MRILVTGGAGFIGSHICDAAIESGHEVAIIDDLSSGNIENIPKEAVFYKANICDYFKVQEIFKDFKPDVVSHHAAQTSVSVSVKNPKLDSCINIIGGSYIIEAAIKYNCKKIVFASTGGAIYGEIPEFQLATEDWIPNPISPYAINKHVFEQLLDLHEEERCLDYTILRYSNVFGPRQDSYGESGVVAIFFDRALKGEPLYVNEGNEKEDDGCIRDYCYIDDVVKANLMAFEGKIDQKVMNVCSGIPISTYGLAKFICSITDSKSEIKKSPHRSGDLYRSVLSPTIFNLKCGENTLISEGLIKTKEWYYKKNKVIYWVFF